MSARDDFPALAHLAAQYDDTARLGQDGEYDQSSVQASLALDLIDHLRSKP